MDFFNKIHFLGLKHTKYGGVVLPEYLYCFEKDGLMGVKSKDSIIIPAEYDKTKILADKRTTGLFYVAASKNGLEVLLSKNNEILISPQFDAITDIYEDYVCVIKNGKKGIVKFGDEIIEECIYDNIRFNQSNFVFYKDTFKWIQNYKLGIPKITISKYDDCGAFHSFCNNPYCTDYVKNIGYEGRKIAVVTKNNKKGWIMDDGTILIPPKYKSVYRWFEPYRYKDYSSKIPMAIVETFNGFYIPVDYRGFYYGIIPAYYKDAIRLNDNRYVVQNRQGKWGIIDKNNNIIGSFAFNGYIPPHGFEREHESFVIMKKDKGMCLVELQTGEIHTSIYDEISWRNTVAGATCFVRNKGKVGLMDVDESIIIPIIYDNFYGLGYNDTGWYAINAQLNGVNGIIENSRFISNDDLRARSKNYKHYFDYDSIPSYGKYAGSYAQDEMGYSDDDIDTIFDGDPSAYWNID